jgi:Tol biopolymer transport system component
MGGAMSRRGMRLLLGMSLPACALVLVGSGVVRADPVGTTALVSLNSDGVQSNGRSLHPALSGNGRYVAFSSSATNLVADDNNGMIDVFVRDRKTGTTRRVSVSSDEVGGAAGGGSYTGPAISADGRYVAFPSDSSNLVSGDTNRLEDVFLRDRCKGTTIRVSVSNQGDQGDWLSRRPVVSAHGGYVAFESFASTLVAGDTNYQGDVFVWRRTTGTIRRVSVGGHGAQANGASLRPAISGHGHNVAFESTATNLVPGDHNDVSDVFVREDNDVTRRVSVSSDEHGGNADNFNASISAHGLNIAFASRASNMVPGDTNHAVDMFVRDLATGTTSRVSVSSDGTQSNGNSDGNTAICGNGRCVVFASDATNLVAGHDDSSIYDVYVRDRWTNTTKQVSLDSNGGSGNQNSYMFAISRDGHHVAFSSFASNLVADDRNGDSDVFIRHTS